jgi:hypothetical protein
MIVQKLLEWSAGRTTSGDNFRVFFGVGHASAGRALRFSLSLVTHSATCLSLPLYLVPALDFSASYKLGQF